MLLSNGGSAGVQLLVRDEGCEVRCHHALATAVAQLLQRRSDGCCTAWLLVSCIARIAVVVSRQSKAVWSECLAKGMRYGIYSGCLPRAGW
jgi:hypothetical protein